jgi:hypothetical protein
MLGVEDEAEVEKMGLLGRVLLIRAKGVEKILGEGYVVTRIVEDKALTVIVVAFDGKGVGYNDGGARGQLHAVAEHIGQLAAVGILVIGI